MFSFTGVDKWHLGPSQADRHSLAPGGKYGTKMTGQQIYSRLAGVPYPNGYVRF